MKSDETQASTFLGIDIGKRELVCCLIDAKGEQIGSKLSVDNTPAGHLKILRWLKKYPHTKVCMEATSSYWAAIAELLNEHGFCVSVEQPLRVAHYAKVLFKRSKSDTADAHTIAIYALRQQPKRWQPLSHKHQHIKALNRRLKQLQKLISQENNHLEHSHDKEVKKMIGAQIKRLENERIKLLERLQESMPGR